MNKNLRKLTEGAVMLGIYGAFLVIDRYLLAHMFSALMLVFNACIVAVYLMRNGKTYYLGMVIGTLALSFLFGDMYVIIYAPLGLVEGHLIGSGYKKNISKNRILMLLMLIAGAYELLSIFLIFPLLGQPVSLQIEELGLSVSALQGAYEKAGVALDTSMFTGSFLKLLLMVSMFITGITEALIIYIVTNLVLKRMKFNVPNSNPLTQMKVPSYLSYVMIFALMAFTYVQRTPDINENIFNVVAIAGMLSAMVLMFEGYVFCLSYGIIVLKRRAGLYVILLIVLLFPVSLIMLIILGFLYAAGPLDNYLIKKRLNNNE